MDHGRVATDKLCLLLSKLSASQILGGYDILDEMSSCALTISKVSVGEHRLLAFMLYSVMRDLAFEQEEGYVATSRAKELWDILGSSLTRAIGLLAGKKNASEFDKINNALLNAYFASQ